MRDVLDRFMANGPYVDKGPETGFSENFMMGVGRTIEEDLSVSAPLDEWLNGRREDRNRQLDQLVATEQLPKQYKDMLGDTISYSEMAEIAKNQFNLTVSTDKDLDDQIRDEFKRNREMAGDVESRASFTGKIGRFAGEMTAYSLDPISVVGMLTGVGAAAKGATFLGRLAYTAGTSAMATMAEEAAIQPYIYNWKNRVGVDYDIVDALRAIGFAGATGAVLGGGARTAQEFVHQAHGFINSHSMKRFIASDPAAKEAAALVEARLLEVQQLAPDTDIVEHFAAVDKYIEAQDNAGPLHITDDIVPSTLESVERTFNATFEGMLPATQEFYEKTLTGKRGLKSSDYEKMFDEKFSEAFKGADITKLTPEEIQTRAKKIVQELGFAESKPATAKPGPSGVVEAKAEPIPYVERVEGEGNNKKIVMGDAVAKTQELNTKLESLERFKSCLKG